MAAWLGERGVSRLRAHIHPEHEASMAVARSVGLAPADVVDGRRGSLGVLPLASPAESIDPRRGAMVRDRPTVHNARNRLTVSHVPQISAREMLMCGKRAGRARFRAFCTRPWTRMSRRHARAS